jgi:hypothetical protein
MTPNRMSSAPETLAGGPKNTVEPLTFQTFQLMHSTPNLDPSTPQAVADAVGQRPVEVHWTEGFRDALAVFDSPKTG